MAKSRTRFVVSPDAAVRVRAAREWLAALPADAEVLVVCPALDGSADLVRDLVGERGAAFGTHRLTLDQTAARLAATTLAGAGRVPARPLAVEAVVARAVHLLRTAGELGHLHDIADRPGLAPAIGRTLAELRMHDVSPEVLAALAHIGPTLATIARSVQRELDAVALVDRADIYAAALQTDPPGHPARLPVLFLDVPIASRREEALVARLVALAPAACATAPAGDVITIERLARACGTKPARARVKAPASSLEALKEHLFEDTAPSARPLDASVALAALPGEARECVEIVRGVLAAAGRGVPFDRIAVLLREPTAYVAHLEEAFDRAQVPVFLARGARRPHPAGRAFMALLACASESLSARRFAEYLSLGQVPSPQAPEDPDRGWRPPADDEAPAADVEADGTVDDPDTAGVVAGTVRTPARWEQLLVEAAVIGKKERWVRRLDGLAHDLEHRQRATDDDAQAARLARTRADLHHLRECALPLIERLEALPDGATWGRWLEALRSLALAALREPGDVLERLAELDPLGPVGPVDLDDVQLVLGPRLRDAFDARPPHGRYGRVFVAPIDAARGMTFDVVFVPGLAEKLFPGKIVEDPILLDLRRRALAGVGLVTEGDRVAAERLRLRLAVGAAERTVALSYPRVDVEQARPRVPSFYALEVLRAAEGQLPGLDALVARAQSAGNARLGWPAPAAPGDAIDEAEYDLALLAPLLDVDDATKRGTAHYLVDANPHLGRALRARGRRWIKRWTSADGLVDPDDLARAALARHRLAARSFSPTALQHYAACPYRFFLQAIHRLAPRDEIVVVEQMDPLTRGSLVHDVQCAVLTTLRDGGALPLDPAQLEQATALVDTVLAREAARFHDDLAPAIERVWDDAVAAIRADLREWLRQVAGEPDWVPHRFELSFGIADRDRSFADTDSVAEPVAVEGGLAVRGSIDLVERHRDGRLRVTDYKTGKVYGDPGLVVAGGTVLQPVLYALVAEQVLGAPVVEGRLYFCTTTGGWAERTVAIDRPAREAAAQVAATVDQAIADGFLPAAPAAHACRYCDYRSVCGPYEEIRIARKPQDRLAPLERLRNLP